MAHSWNRAVLIRIHISIINARIITIATVILIRSILIILVEVPLLVLLFQLFSVLFSGAFAALDRED